MSLIFITTFCSLLSGQAVLFSDDFETDKGWTLLGEFERGTPGGLGGEHGNPDPNSAVSGSNVLGVDLTGLGTYPGDYETNLINGSYTAISPSINCNGYQLVVLNFQRWLNVEEDAFDNAYIEVSNDGGSTWDIVWENGGTTITDNAWSLQSYDISAFAANESDVLIRFHVGETDGGWQYSGWNIDDFEVTGQSILWQEDFTYADGTTTGTGSPAIATWVSDGVDGSARGVDVRGGQMRGRRTLTPGLTTWEIDAADPIEISAFTDVSITMDVYDGSNMEATDNVLIEYELDGSGSWIEFATNGNPSNDFTFVEASQTGLSGTTLRLRVTFTTDGNENHFIDNINVTGIPTSAGATGEYYYSYQSGNWDDVSTWTHDPGGTTQTATDIPNSGDNVIILNNRTVSLDVDVDTTNLDITIREGGILDQSTFEFIAGISALRGPGTHKLSSVNYPMVTTNDFVDTDAGTTEYNNAADFTLPIAQTTYYHLTLNAPGVTATQLNDLTLNGNLYIDQGTYQINDNTANRRQLLISGDVTVDNGAYITVGTGVTNTTTNPTAVAEGGTAPFINYYDAQSHRIVVYGDFTNNGSVKLTNLTYPIFDQLPPTTLGTTTGFATLYFMGATSNTLTCNGTTDLYNLVIDKGIDKSFSLTVYSSAYSNFRIFGANTAGGYGGGANPNLNKALWIRTGSLILQGLTIIPSLSEGTCDSGTGGPNSDFFIPENGALILDGSEVVVLSTADDYREVNIAYNVSGGTGMVNGVGQGGCSSFSVLGKLQINNGYFSTRESGGFITWSDASGQFIINGGTIDAKQFRSAGGVGGLASFTQTGGTLLLRGRFQRVPTAYSTVDDLKDFSTATINTNRTGNGIDGTYGTFNLNEVENVYNMSDGTIRIFDACGTGGRVFDVFSSAGNINVSGGTVEFQPTTGSGGGGDAAIHYVQSNAPFYNFTINRASSTSTVQLNTYNLTVQNDLNLTSGVLNAADYNISIGGDFNIENGTTYIPGNNSTTFNGNSNQFLTINNAGSTAIKKLKIDKPAGTSLILSGTFTTLSIEDSLAIYNAELADGGKIVQLATSATSTTSVIYNSGLHSGAGSIEIADDDPTIITGDGTGIFENINLNNTDALVAPVSLGANININGTLTFSQDKLLNIGQYNLNLGSSASVVNAGTNRFIQTSGAAGDGGVTKQYSASATSFTFPVGAASTGHAAAEYTPAIISFGALPTTFGSITIVPVGYEHPNTINKGRSLTYFWRTKSAGFDLGSAIVNHSYIYSQNDVVTGGDVNENEYIAASYDNATFNWTKEEADDIDETNNIIGGTGTDWQALNYIDGEFTAGDDGAIDPFGTPTVFYSRQSGLWGNTATWSLTDHNTDDPPAIVPGANDIVIIGGNDSVYLDRDRTWAYTTDNVDPRSCATLQVEAGSALDIGYNTNTSFGVVLSHANGNGNIRITLSSNSGSTYVFPSGDFSDYNINLGTTELYSTNPNAGTTYWLPNGTTEYGNLIISPLGGSNIIFPNNDLLIYGNLITRGQNSESWFCPNWSTQNYPTVPTAVVPKTITINGDFDIQGGALVYYNRDNTGAQDFVIYGDLKVASDAGIQVFTNGTNNTQSFSIGGDFINNSLAPAGGVNGYRGCDFTNIPLTFFGSSTNYITNDNPGDNTYTNIETLIINKGTSQADSLVVDITGNFNTPNDGWLTLQNGTFKYLRDADLNITTNSTFTISSSAGLYVNAPGRTIRLANASSNTNDVYLSGKLTIIDGNVTVGNTNNNNQDIEYSGGGGSEIDIQGGTLFVNGQIRRNPATTAGVLKYNQTNGDVTINGRNTLTSNAKLEILNTDSEFNMSGGTLTIVRGGGGGTYGDLYLRPDNSTVSGGEIIFNPSGAGDQDYFLDATVPIYDLTINGSGGDDANVQLLISPLEVNGDLSLVTSTSFLDANVNFDIDVTLNGDFSNNGTYFHQKNHTYFTGGEQFILGSSNIAFYDLTVSPVTSLTLNKDATVNNDLVLSSGTLICDTYTVNAKGNVTNNATYTDNNAGISLNGTALQYIGGTGTWGQLELNNSVGARIVNDITLQSDFLLTNGVMDINRYLFTLGVNSDIVGSGYDNTKMITSDGVFSNVGINKVFSGTADGTFFTFPLGTSGKYTPAVLTITDIGTTGSVRLNNINSHHSGVLHPDNVLDYFWELESSGITGFNGSLSLKYLDSDVQVTGLNTEAEYIAAALLLPGTSWSKAAVGPATDRVDEVNDSIIFNFSGSSSLSGEYTAGIDTALPNQVPEYTSINNGNWSDPANWLQTGGDAYTLTSGPNGFIVTIATDDTVTTDVNYASAYKTTISGTLFVPSTSFGHNLGTVSGSGTLLLENGTFPAGRYTDFLDCSNGSTIEYGGSGTYAIIADLFSAIPNLHFTGTGTRTLPNKDLTICNQLLIDGPTLDNSVSNRMLTIQGTMERYNTGAFLSGTGSGATVSFEGTAAQTIGGALGDFTGANAFNNLEIDNNSGLTINNTGQIEVTGNLLLTDGLITTSSTNTLSISNTLINCVSPSGGSSSSYVNGPLTKRINQGDNFSFPIGKGSTLGNKINLSSTQSGTQNWTVEYFTPNGTASSMTSPLTYVNNDEYWTVTSATGNEAIINLNWNTSSDLTPLMTQNGLSDMRVARYNTMSTEWEQLASSASGTSSAGTVSTTSRDVIPAAGSLDFTLACINAVKPRAQFTPSGAICGTTVGIPVSFTYSGAIPFDYTLDYTIDGVPQTQLSIASGDVVAGVYTLATSSIGVYQLTAFRYNNGADLGVVDPTTVEVYELPTTADIGSDSGIDDDDISDCGASQVLNLPGNNPAVGSGLWSVVSGTGGSFVAPTVFNTEFNGTNGSTYELEWEITNGACTSSDTMTVAFPLLAQQPAAFSAGQATVCQSTTGVVYTVPNDPSVTYAWDYSGSGETYTPAVPTGNSVTIDFDATATSGTLSVNATNGCGTSADRTMAITLNSRPTPSFTAEVTSTTIGSTGNIYTTQAGQLNYVWNISAGGTVTSGGTATDNSVTITWTGGGAQTVTVNYDNADGCDGLSAAVSNVTVSILPVPTLSSSDANDTICAGESVTFTAGGGDEYEFLVNGVSVQAQSAINVYTSTTLSDNDTVYVRAVYVPSGAADTSLGIGMTVHALPDLTLTVDASLDSICTGNNTQIEIDFTAGTAPYDFTVQRERVVGTVLVNENLTNISADPYTYTPASAPVWVDFGTFNPVVVYNYSVLTITDDNGCTNTSIGDVPVAVFKIPETGPQYHIGNTWGQ